MNSPNINTKDCEDLQGFINEFFSQPAQPAFSCKFELLNDKKDMPQTDSEANHFIFQLLSDIFKGGLQYLFNWDKVSELSIEQVHVMNKYMNSLGFYILLNPSKEQLELFKSSLLPYKLYLISHRQIELFSKSPFVVFGELQS